MIKKKKLDDLDLVFIDEPWTEEERKAFSAFIKQRKEQRKGRKLKPSIGREHWRITKRLKTIKKRKAL